MIRFLSEGNENIETLKLNERNELFASRVF